MARSHTSSRSLINIKEMESKSYNLKINFLETMNFRAGSYIKSPVFSVGGYEWMLFYYPKGNKADQGAFVSLYVFLRTIAKNVHAIFDFTLVDNNGSLSLTNTKRISQSFSYDTSAAREFPGGWVHFFTQEDAIEKYLLDDGHIAIICTVTITQSDSDRSPESSSVAAPLLDFHEHFANLRHDKDMLDVAFEVKGEIFQAHKLVLAARSPVLKNMLFGPAREENIYAIRIDEIQPSIFKMILHFIYTNRFPENEELASEANDCTTTQQLLVAADLYALDSMKLMCEERLCSELSIDTFATTLVLAHLKNCARLKAACLYFASHPENFSKIALTDEYLNLSVAYPSILRELRGKFNNKST